MDDIVVQIAVAAIVVILVAVLFIGLWRWSSTSAPEEKEPVMICAGCGSYGRPKTVQPGSALIAIILLILFLVPGIFYILWRQMGTRRVCPSCASTEMVPINSPRGIKLQNEFHN